MSVKLTRLYADLQANPGAAAVYRRLAEHYAKTGLANEAAAFTELAGRFVANSPDVDQEQRHDRQGLP